MSYPSITSRPTQGTGIAVSGSTVSLDQSFTDTRYVNTSGDTMTGVLSVVSGFAFSPGLRFDTDTDTGLYSAGSDILGVSVGGTLRLSISTTSVTSTLPCYVPGGSSVTPSYSFTNSPASGLFALSSTLIALGVNSTSTVLFFPTMTSFVQPIVTSNDATIHTITVGLGAGAVADNTAVGVSVLNANTTGFYNTGVGYHSLISNISGAGNTAVGYNSLSSVTTSQVNTALGYSTLQVSTASNNTAIGGYSLAGNTTGSGNTAVGGNTLYTDTTGANNTVIGFGSGVGITTGSGNTIIGANVSGLSAALSNNIIISNGAGAIKAQHDGTNWTLTGNVTSPTFIGNLTGNASNNVLKSGDVMTGYLGINDGNSAAPILRFANDTNTGIYSDGSAKFGISVDGLSHFSLGTNGTSHLRSGTSLTLGAEVGAVTLNTNTNKQAKIVIPHYDNGAQSSFEALTFTSTSSNNVIQIGGGSGTSNVATSIVVYVAANNTTLNGIPMVLIDTNGLSMVNHKITGLATPTSNNDAATKAYVDSVSSGLNVKAAVIVATTANITLSGTQTIDGVAVIAGDRVLVKNQSTGSQNGIYIVAAGAWTRSTDADISAEVTSGMYCLVTSGSTNGGEGWILTTSNPIALGTTSLTFAQFSSSTSYIQGTGITISGNTVALDTSYTDTRYINGDGDTMLGTLGMNGNWIVGVATPTLSTHAANKTYVDTAVASKLSRSDLKLLPNNGDVDLTVSDTHDSGMITHTDGVVRSYTLGTGGSTGMTTTFVNNSATSVNLVQGSSTTVRQTGTTNTGTRTLGAFGMATVVKVNSNTWFVSGAQLT